MDDSARIILPAHAPGLGCRGNWALRDPDEVHREFKPTTKDSPVDYALKLNRSLKLFVEAKGLGEDMADRRWIGQVLGYAVVAGVVWCVLTDGDQWSFYNAIVPEDADRKMLCRLRLSETPAAEAAQMLRLVSRDNLEDNLIDQVWTEHHVDRQVKESLRALIDEPDPGLLRLLRTRTPGLGAKDVAASIRRLVIHIDPTDHLGKNPVAVEPAPRAKQNGKPAGDKRGSEIGMIDLITAGLLRPPLELVAVYKKARLTATLHPDGAIEYDGKRYPAPSAAGEAALTKAAGRKLRPNGWDFWRVADSAGKTQTLGNVRAQLNR